MLLRNIFSDAKQKNLYLSIGFEKQDNILSKKHDLFIYVLVGSLTLKQYAVNHLKETFMIH